LERRHHPHQHERRHVPRPKEHNGKIEVFNANLAKELFDVHRFWDVTEMKRRLSTHPHWYNHARTHHALGGLLVPADRYYGRAEEVLARIESGALREGGRRMRESATSGPEAGEGGGYSRRSRQ